MSTPEKEYSDLEKAQVRIIDLENGLCWWLGERMKNFTEDQYGKRQMRQLLNNEKP